MNRFCTVLDKIPWIKKYGILALLFFLLKGLIWLVLGYVIFN